MKARDTMNQTHIRLFACFLALLLLVGALTGCISANAEEATPPNVSGEVPDTSKAAENTPPEEESIKRLELDRSRIVISVWDYTRKVSKSEEGAASLKDFGTDLVLHPSKTAAFDQLTKYGIPVLGMNLNVPYSSLSQQLIRVLRGIRNGEYDNIADKYSREPSVIGDYLYDEIAPKKDVFLTFRRIMQTYNEQMPGQLGLMILNPAWEEGAVGDFASYKDYVEMYCRMIPSDLITFDVYPFFRNTGNIVADFLDAVLYTYDINAEAARKYGKDMWVILQAGSEYPATVTDKQMTNETIRYQVFTALAYGATGLSYANYTPSWWEDGTSLWQSDSKNVGEKTPLWDICKPINDEIHALSDTFMKYESMGVYTFGSSVNPSLNRQLQRQNMRSEENGYTAESIDGFTGISTDGGILVGGFLEKGGDGCAAMFVNQTNPFTADADTTVTFRVTGEGKTVTAHHHGGSEVLTATDGVYSIIIGSAEGVFVTVE